MNESRYTELLGLAVCSQNFQSTQGRYSTGLVVGPVGYSWYGEVWSLPLGTHPTAFSLGR